jgi:hypothetical protein
MRALEACLDKIAFADCLLLTDAHVQPSHPDMRIVQIERLDSSAAYSEFLLSRLVDYIGTSHCLVAQWDGYVLDAERWRAEFLDYDYIGASWPQFEDGHDVGNGGFSLRSRRLMELCRAADFVPAHPEDLAIGRINRLALERQGIRFAPRETADLFSAERVGDLASSLGFHGVFNMPRALGVDTFRQVYDELDDLGTVHHDLSSIVKDLWRHRGGSRLSFRMLAHRVAHLFRKRPKTPDAQNRNTQYKCDPLETPLRQQGR